MEYFTWHTKIAFFLIICLLIAPAFVVYAATSDDAPSINGKIAYTSDSDGEWGNWDIYVMNADGTGQTQLTNSSAEDGYPSWAPNGTKIVFHSERDGHPQIYVMNADGSEQTRLTSNSFNDWAPDWSPDGSRIAFTSDRDGNPEIYVMNVDGTGQTRLTFNSYVDATPRWSPDGTKILWDSDRGIHWDIYVMNANGTGQTRLTNNIGFYDGEGSWSPDGTRIAFCSDRDGNYEIYVMNADGTGVTRLTNNAYEDGELAWSPDGAKIVFASTRDGNYEMYLMNADGTGQTRLTNTTRNEFSPSWQAVAKLPLQTATLTLLSSATNTTVNTQFDLNGSLSVPKTGSVTLYWSINCYCFDFSHGLNMTDGQFSRSFAAGSPGTWAFKVVWSGDDQYEGAESNVVTVIVSTPPVVKQNATLTMQPSATNVAAGSTVTLSGVLSPAQAGNVAIFRSINAGSFVSIGTTALVNGTYSYQTVLNDPGTYSFYALWAGNANYNASSSIATAVTSTAAPGLDPLWYVVIAIVIIVAIAAAVYFMRKK